MPVTKINFKPGVVRNTTSYSNEGGWFYCDKIRFRGGEPESIGGWTRFTIDAYIGTCTALMPWASLGGIAYTAVGTNQKYYIEYGTQLFDITPIRSTTAAGDVTFSATSGSATIEVTDTGHGAFVGDFVTFSGAVSLGGNITAAVLNQEYQITAVPDTNTYEFTATATANASDTGNGGAAVVGEYQINTGLAVYVAGVGWGSDGWGTPAWGGTTVPSVPTQLRLWTQAPFGEDLVFCDRGGSLYYWDTSVGVSARGMYITGMGGASDVPVIANGVFVTDSRHVVAFGVNPYEDPPVSTQDPLLVRWSDRESAVDWTPTATNTAGGQRLTLGTEILCAHNTRLETLMFTDTALYSMRYVGGGFEFGFNLLGTPISVIGPLGVAIVGGDAYWMGQDKFYVYNGTVNTLPCPLQDLLFHNLNHDQSHQVFAATNELFTEVSWFYCSSNSTMVDSYITYNYGENVWYFGTMNRSAWADAGVNRYPIAANSDANILVYHEVGVDDATTGTPTAINAYIESSDFDLGDGDHFMFISRLIPDISFIGSTVNNPAVTFTIKTRNSPGEDWISSTNEPSSSDVVRTANGSLFTSPIQEYTPQAWVRLRGRQAVIRVEKNSVGVSWHLGALRLDMRPDGRRG